MTKALPVIAQGSGPFSGVIAADPLSPQSCPTLQSPAQLGAVPGCLLSLSLRPSQPVCLWKVEEQNTGPADGGFSRPGAQATYQGLLTFERQANEPNMNVKVCALCYLSLNYIR